jgi:hypothetical protein
MRSFVISILTRYEYNDKIKEDVIGGVWSTHGEKGTVLRVLLGKTEVNRQSGIP